MNKHTPGPWNPMWTGRGKMVFHNVSATAPAIPGFCGERRIEIASISGIDPEVDSANARLIAAAPDLIIELRQAIIQMEMAAECIEKGRYDEALLHVSSLMRSEKEVLAKATGESE